MELTLSLNPDDVERVGELRMQFHVESDEAAVRLSVRIVHQMVRELGAASIAMPLLVQRPIRDDLNPGESQALRAELSVLRGVIRTIEDAAQELALALDAHDEEFNLGPDTERPPPGA